MTKNNFGKNLKIIFDREKNDLGFNWYYIIDLFDV